MRYYQPRRYRKQFNPSNIFGAPREIRTPNQRCRRPMLYPLSYEGTIEVYNGHDDWIWSIPASPDNKPDADETLICIVRYFDLFFHERTIKLRHGKMERVVRIELTTQTWKDCILPLNYTRIKCGVSSGSHGNLFQS